MKNIKDFILESSTNNINKFKNFLKKYNVVLQGPDNTRIAYITQKMDDEYPFICIETYDDYWNCYLDENEDGEIWVSLDKEGAPDKQIDSSNFEKSNNGYTYSEKNAKELANQFLNIIKEKK